MAAIQSGCAINAPFHYLWLLNKKLDCWWCIHNKSFSFRSLLRFAIPLSMWLIGDETIYGCSSPSFRLSSFACVELQSDTAKWFSLSQRCLCLSTQLSIRLVYTQSVPSGKQGGGRTSLGVWEGQKWCRSWKIRIKIRSSWLRLKLEVTRLINIFLPTMSTFLNCEYSDK